MLNKQNRISNRQLIDKLFKKGRLYKNNYFIFRYLPSDHVSRFAVVVSKKISSKAVDRNKLRRQVNESIRLNISMLKINIVSLIIAKPGAEEASYEELNEGIIEFFKQDKLHG